MKKQLSEWEIKMLGSKASLSIQELARLAERGDRYACIQYCEVVMAVVSRFDEFCHTHSGDVEPIARKHSTWPGHITCHKDVEKQNAELVKKLNLGHETGLNFKGRQWSIDTPATRAALRIYSMLKGSRETWQRRREMQKRRTLINKELGRPSNYRPKPVPAPKLSPAMAKEFALYEESFEMVKKLAPLSRVNYQHWFRAAWPTFIARYGENYEDCNCFAQFWTNKTFAGASNPRARIKDAIKKQIKLGFKSIAPKSDI